MIPTLASAQNTLVFHWLAKSVLQKYCPMEIDRLSELPEEMLVHLATFLSGKDIRALGLTSKHLLHITGKRDFWTGALAREGMLPVSDQVL